MSFLLGSNIRPHLDSELELIHAMCYVQNSGNVFIGPLSSNAANWIYLSSSIQLLMFHNHEFVLLLKVQSRLLGVWMITKEVEKMAMLLWRSRRRAISFCLTSPMISNSTD
uniref:Uncharacterized protein n=1 Tax=Noccaea caerulescens TaxID=107243 RepID=A0A1J3ICE3_NOCCA